MSQLLINCKFLKPTDGGFFISVHAVPNARKTEIVGIHGEALKIKVQAPPVDGKANDEIQNFLAAVLGQPKKTISLKRGDKSREKFFYIESTASAEEICSRLGLPA